MERALHSSNPRVQDQLTPLLWVSLAFLSGIVLASLIALPVWSWLFLAALILVLWIILPRLPRRALVLPLPNRQTNFYLLLFIFLVLGGARYQASVPKITPNFIAYYNDRDYDLLVTGILSEPADERDTYTNLKMRVESVDAGESLVATKGMLLAQVSANDSYEYGQRIRLRGRLITPPENEDFSYRDYLARQDIHAFMVFPEVSILPGPGGNPFFALVSRLKEKSLSNVYRLFPDPEASLLAGILLGVDTGLNRDLRQAFNNTGTAHIIAISGFNIAIIAGVFITVFNRLFGPRFGTLTAILGIIFYTVLVGASASVVRAAFMGSLALFGKQIGRRPLALHLLAFSAMLMCLGNPRLLWDVGFQLSFLATLGLVLYAEPFTKFTLRLISKFGFQDATSDKIIQPIADFILLTLAAQLATLPIMAYHFQRISLVSLLANPFILPAQPAVMILGGLAVFLSLILFPIGQLIAWIAWPFAFYTIRIVEIFNRIPHGTIYLGNFSLWFALLCYAALFAVTFGWSSIKDWITPKTERIRYISITAVLAMLLLCASLAWRNGLSEGDGRLHITFLDVGSADAILLQTPAGRSVLINGGSSTAALSDPLGRRLPPFRHKLDWLVIGATDEKEVAAVTRLLERFPAQQILWSGNAQASYSARQLNIWLSEHSLPVMLAEEGQRLDLGKDAFIGVAASGPRGSVLTIEWKNFRAVLPLGVDAETFSQLDYGESLTPADILLLADAGYAPSNPAIWIQNLNPQLVVLSVSAGDPDGLPDQETLEKLAGRSLLRTDRNGWISISTDGEQMWVKAEREAAIVEVKVVVEEKSHSLYPLPNNFKR